MVLGNDEAIEFRGYFRAFRAAFQMERVFCVSIEILLAGQRNTPFTGSAQNPRHTTSIEATGDTP
jgi:hypothetical protein